MKHCINCGNQLENNEIFCTNCGTKQQEQHPPSSEVNQEHQPPKKNKKLSMKTKIIFISIIAFIILLFASYKVIEHINRPSQLVQTFIQNVEDDNYKEIQSSLQDSGTDIKLNEKNVKEFVTYLKDQPDYWNTLKAELNDMAEHYEKDNTEAVTNDESIAPLLSVTSNRKKFMLNIHQIWIIRLSSLRQIQKPNLKRQKSHIQQDHFFHMNKLQKPHIKQTLQQLKMKQLVIL